MQNCLTSHEGICFKPRDPTGTRAGRHEFPAVLTRLLQNLGLGGGGGGAGLDAVELARAAEQVPRECSICRRVYHLGEVLMS